MLTDGELSMSTSAKTLITEAEYLAAERQSALRSEFYQGEMFALAGANRRHNRIVTNLVTALDNQLRERPCNVYSTDMRVKIESTGLLTYPDVVVTCGEELFIDDKMDVLLNPLVIIEVLSDSTEAYDRGRKFEHYQTIPSLSTYALVTQNSPRIEQYARQQDRVVWIYSEAHGAEARISLAAISCDLKLEDVYSKVT